MVESDSYGSDHFPIILKIGVSLPDALPRWNLNWADWVQFDNLCKEKLTLDTIELYEEPIVLFTELVWILDFKQILLLLFYVILPRVVCQEPRQNRRNAVSHGLIRNVKMQ